MTLERTFLKNMAEHELAIMYALHRVKPEYNKPLGR